MYMCEFNTFPSIILYYYYYYLQYYTGHSYCLLCVKGSPGTKGDHGIKVQSACLLCGLAMFGCVSDAFHRFSYCSSKMVYYHYT